MRTGLRIVAFLLAIPLLAGGGIGLWLASAGEGKATEIKTRAKLSAPRFELSDFAGWLPGLAASGVSGGVALEALAASFDPLSLRGGMLLDGVNAPVGETRGVLSGRLEGQGDALVGDAMELRLAEQLFRIGLTIDSLASEPQAKLRLASEGADAGKLVSGISGKAATLEGPLALMECSAGPGHCEQESSCGVREPWQRINRTVQVALQGMTLAELAGPQTRLVGIERVRAPSPAARS